MKEKDHFVSKVRKTIPLSPNNKTPIMAKKKDTHFHLKGYFVLPLKGHGKLQMWTTKFCSHNMQQRKHRFL